MTMTPARTQQERKTPASNRIQQAGRGTSLDSILFPSQECHNFWLIGLTRQLVLVTGPEAWQALKMQ